MNWLDVRWNGSFDGRVDEGYHETISEDIAENYPVGGPVLPLPECLRSGR